MAAFRRRVLILQDFPVRPGGLHDRLRLDSARYAVEVVDSRMPRAFSSTLQKVLVVWTGYLGVAARGWRRSRPTDVVVARHGAIGLFFAALQRLFGRSWPRLIVIGYIYAARRGLAGRFRRWFFRWASRAVDTAVVGSRVEIETYERQLGLPRELFVAVPPSMYPMPVLGPDLEQPYILAAGRSLRDYRTLADAVCGLEVQTQVIAAPYNLAGIDLPENVVVREGVYGDAFCEAVSRALAVIVPLNTAEVAAGQMVVLQAMAARRPVIASDTPCLREYIANGENGVLVPLGDAEALRAAITELVGDAEKREATAARGYETWERGFTDAAYAAKLAALIERP